MSIPPLHIGVIGSCKGRVGFEQMERHPQIVDHIQHGHTDQGGHDVPERDIHLLFLTLKDRHEHIDREKDPDDGNYYCKRPFQFGVFFGAVDPHGQRHGSRGNGNIKNPERHPCQLRTPERRFGESLRDIKKHGNKTADAPAENTGIGMDRTQTTIRQIRRNIQLRPGQLQGDQDADYDSNCPPDDAPCDEAFYRVIHIPRWCFHASAPFRRLERIL